MLFNESRGDEGLCSARIGTRHTRDTHINIHAHFLERNPWLAKMRVTGGMAR